MGSTREGNLCRIRKIAIHEFEFKLALPSNGYKIMIHKKIRLLLDGMVLLYTM